MFVPPSPAATAATPPGLRARHQAPTALPSLAGRHRQQQDEDEDGKVTMTTRRGNPGGDGSRTQGAPPSASRMVDNRSGGATTAVAAAVDSMESATAFPSEAGAQAAAAAAAAAAARSPLAAKAKQNEEEGGLIPTAVVANEEVFPGFKAAKQVLDGDDWRHKTMVLRQLLDHLSAGAPFVDRIQHLAPFMEALATLCRALRDARPEISGSSRITQLVSCVTSELAKALGGEFCASAAAIIPELLPFLNTPREVVQEAVASCVEAVLAECHSPAVLRAATVTLVGSKKAYLRRKGSGFLCVAIESWPKVVLRTTLPPIMGQMRKALFDADATVRREGRHTFGLFIKMWPAEGGGMYHALDRANQRAVLQEQPHVSNFVAGKTGHEGVTSATMQTTAAAASAASNTTAAAATSAATRVAMAEIGGGRGGGGQRPAGVTQAQQRSLFQWKLEKDREREKQREQQHLAAVATKAKGTGTGLAPAPPSTCDAAEREYARRPFDSSVGPSATKGVGRSLGRSNLSALSTAATTVEGMARIRSPSSHSLRHAPRAPRSPSASSDGLRRAAGLALQRNELMSPTLRRALKQSSQLQAPAAGVGASSVSPAYWGKAGGMHHGFTADEGGGDQPVEEVAAVSPGSEESTLGMDEDGSEGERSCMTPAELRPSMGGYDNKAFAKASPYATALATDISGAEKCLSDDGGSSESECEGDDGEGHNEVDDLPTRVLFRKDESESSSPRITKTLTSVVDAHAAVASSHDLRSRTPVASKPPPSQLPAKISRLPSPKTRRSTFAVSTRSTRYGLALSSKGGGAVSDDAIAYADTALTSPRALAVQNASSLMVNCTPTRGILSSGGIRRGGSSTAKRRVRFLMEGPQQSVDGNGERLMSSAGRWWWARKAVDCQDGTTGSSGGARQRRCRRVTTVVSAMIVVLLSAGAIFSPGGGHLGDVAVNADSVDTFSFDPPGLLSLVEPVVKLAAPSVVIEEGADGGGPSVQEAREEAADSGGHEQPTEGICAWDSEAADSDKTAMTPRRRDDNVGSNTSGTEVDVKDKPLGNQSEEEVELLDSMWLKHGGYPAPSAIVNVGVDADIDEDMFENGREAPDLVLGSETVRVDREAMTSRADVSDLDVDMDYGFDTVERYFSVEITEGEGEGENTVEVDGVDAHEGTRVSVDDEPAIDLYTSAAKETANVDESAKAGIAGMGGSQQQQQQQQSSDRQQTGDHKTRHSHQDSAATGEPVQEDGGNVAESRKRPQMQNSAVLSRPGISGASTVATTAVFGVRQAAATEARPSSPSVWGWIEVGAAMLGAVALLATVICKSRSNEKGEDFSLRFGEPPSTPTGQGTGGAAEEEMGTQDLSDDQFGSYNTVEMVKRGSTPAKLRSVKRSRRISSAQKSPNPGMIVMDLGANALSFSNA